MMDKLMELKAEYNENLKKKQEIENRLEFPFRLSYMESHLYQSYCCELDILKKKIAEAVIAM